MYLLPAGRVLDRIFSNLILRLRAHHLCLINRLFDTQDYLGSKQCCRYCSDSRYKDGANLGMANMLFVSLEGFWSKTFRRKFLLHFQQMFRSRTRERFTECEALVRKEMGKVYGDRAEILRYFWPSFALLGPPHIVGLPKRVCKRRSNSRPRSGGITRSRVAE
jgi:hypothetical protein